MLDMEAAIDRIRAKEGFLCDMDGVIYHGNRLLDGAKEFVEWLYRENKRFLFLTNSSERSPRELRQKLQRMGMDISEEHFLYQCAGYREISARPAAGLHSLRDRRTGSGQRPV